MKLARLRALAPRLLRASAAVSVLAFLGTMVFVRQVHAQVDDMAVHFGDELTRVAGEQQISGAVDGDFYRVSINGAHANVATAVTRSDVTTVIDELYAGCEKHADGMADDFKDLRRTVEPGAKHANTGAPGFGALKNRVDNDKGYVLCFANGHELSSVESVTLLREAMETGDLTKVGHIRYITARKQGDGTTMVVAVWTDSPINVKTMFPEEGDTPGSDPANIARPNGSRRLLTATVQGAPAAVRVYEVPMNEDDAMKFYLDVMPKAGFPVAVDSDDPKAGRIFTNGPVSFLVGAKNTEPGKSVVSMTESRIATAR